MDFLQQLQNNINDEMYNSDSEENLINKMLIENNSDDETINETINEVDFHGGAAPEENLINKMVIENNSDEESEEETAPPVQQNIFENYNESKNIILKKKKEQKVQFTKNELNDFADIILNKFQQNLKIKKEKKKQMAIDLENEKKINVQLKLSENRNKKRNRRSFFDIG